MATQTLSPKRAPERLQQHRHYVIVLAHQSALKTIKAKLRAQGIKLHDFSARDLRIQAEAYFDANRQQLIDEAKGVSVLCTMALAVLWTGSAKAGTEKTQLFRTTRGDFRGSCLLIAD